MNTALASVKQTFGQALKVAREKQHTSIAQQCQALGVSRADYEAWEADQKIPDSGQMRRLMAWDRTLTRYQNDLRVRRAAAGGVEDDEEMSEPPSLLKVRKSRVRREHTAQIDTAALRQALGVPDSARILVMCPGMGDMDADRDGIELHVAWEEIEES